MIQLIHACTWVDLIANGAHRQGRYYCQDDETPGYVVVELATQVMPKHLREKLEGRNLLRERRKTLLALLLAEEFVSSEENE